MSENQQNINDPKKTTSKVVKNAKELNGDVWKWFIDLIDLKKGMDREGTIINIKNNKRMRGASAWLLICSIMIASLGLDLNSPAVIIGAMLISPLMSPILGIGLAVGINDRQTLIISGQHLLIAIIIALVTSTVYFLGTGFLSLGGGFTPEIKGRTAPNILDAMVAFIGGLAGIISSSRKDKSNAIPGVAIATALMPPLCVTGYGLANFIRFGIENQGLDFVNIIWNSFFLFFLNATLVALATFSIVRLLRFPQRTYESKAEQRKSKFALYGISLFLLGFSIFTSFEAISENRKKNSIKNFIDEQLSKVVNYDIRKNEKTDVFDVYVSVMNSLSAKDSLALCKTLQTTYGVSNSTLTITDLPDLDVNIFKDPIQQEVLRQLQIEALKIQKRNTRADSLQAFINYIQSDTLLENALVEEIITLYKGKIKDIDLYKSDGNDIEGLKPHIIDIKWVDKRPKDFSEEEETRLIEFIKVRAKLKEVKVIYEDAISD